MSGRLGPVVGAAARRDGVVGRSAEEGTTVGERSPRTVHGPGCMHSGVRGKDQSSSPGNPD